MNVKALLTGRQQRAVLLLLLSAGIVLWVYAAYIIGPLRRQESTLTQQLQSARQQLSALQRTTANEATLREQYRQLDRAVIELKKWLPDESELAAAIERLSDLASQTSVKIQTISPQRTTETALGARTAKTPASAAPSTSKFYKEVLIQIDASAGYHELGNFLGLVESGERPLRLVTLRIIGDPADPKRHRIKMLIRSYFAVKQTT